MGISSSALPELAVVAVRAAGPAFSTVAFLRGRYAYAVFLWLLVHFVILMPLDVPLLADTEATFAYAVTHPLLAFGFAILATLNFQLLRLGELLPLNRYLAGWCGGNLGSRPSGAFILVNVLGWFVVSVVSQLVFEWFVSSDVVLAAILLIGIIVVGYAALLLIHLFWLSTDAPAWGDGSSVLRTILVTGVYHLVAATVGALVVVFGPTNNAAWIGALIVLIVELVVTLIVHFTLARVWTVPPRTGDMRTFKKIAGVKDDLPLTSGDSGADSDWQPADTDGSSTGARYGSAPVFNNKTDAKAPLFSAKYE